MGVTPASAQTDKATVAEALFAQGRELMDAGDYEHACSKFVESQRLDAGSGTLLNLAACYERLGKTASAWSTYKEAISAAREHNRPRRVEYAKVRAAKLEPMLSRVNVKVPDNHRVPGMSVLFDNVSLHAVAWGVPLPADPGQHVLKVTAPGRKTWSKVIKVGGKADVQQVRVPALASAETNTKVPATDPGAEASESSRAVWGYTVGGVGLVALGIGSYFGIEALSTWDRRNEHCQGAVCDVEGAQANQDVKTYGNISTVGFGLGLVGVGIGGYLLLTAPTTGDEAPSKAQALRIMPSVGKTTAGVTVGGAW